MMLRGALWLVFLIGVAAATPDGGVAPGVIKSGEYRVAIADLHVHAFLGDGALIPWAIRREAARRGVDVIGLTNHNQMYSARIDAALFPPPVHPLMLPGVEVTTPNYHLIALGISEPIDWRLSISDAIRAVHAQGGVAIAAHPYGDFWQTLDPETLASLDGLEVAHPLTAEARYARRFFEALYKRARTIKPTIAAIGSSDYHFGAPIGLYQTRMLVRELTREGVLEAIRAGRTVAFDPSGARYGASEWVTAVSDAQAPRSPDSPRHHMAMFAAWIALVMLVIVAPRPRAKGQGCASGS
jgi:hypothetical protein